ERRHEVRRRDRARKRWGCSTWDLLAETGSGECSDVLQGVRSRQPRKGDVARMSLVGPADVSTVLSRAMTKARLEAFSDGVIAILITIMVLELKVPEGEELDALRHLRSHFLAYLLSFVFLGIYWNNHHHMLHTTERVNGAILWANLHLLFWLS